MQKKGTKAFQSGHMFNWRPSAVPLRLSANCLFSMVQADFFNQHVPGCCRAFIIQPKLLESYDCELDQKQITAIEDELTAVLLLISIKFRPGAFFDNTNFMTCIDTSNPAAIPQPAWP
jgi:hypothetical protein